MFIKDTKRTIEWTNQPPKRTNQPPKNTRGLNNHQVLKGPVGKPQGRAKDCKTPLAGILI